MGLISVDAGSQAPQQVNVIIEIPMFGQPVKYEIDKATGTLFVDRFLNTAMYYPFNYGYVPQTLSEDGDPVDVLVMTPVPLCAGAVIPARPIGMLKMTDEAGHDAKILAVPTNKLTKMYQNIHSPKDVADHILHTIQHFFEHYKDLEPGKWVKVEEWVGREQAEQEIVASMQRYQQQAK